MDVNKLLKLIGPKLKQDELDVFLGVVLAADQCYGDSQVELTKQRRISEQLQKELDRLRFQSYMDRCTSPVAEKRSSEIAGSQDTELLIKDLQYLCSLHQAEKQALLIANSQVTAGSKKRIESNHNIIIKQLDKDESSLSRLLLSSSSSHLPQQGPGSVSSQISKNKIAGYRRERSEAISQSVNSYSNIMSQLSSTLRDQQNSLNEITKAMDKTFPATRLSELSGRYNVVTSHIHQDISKLSSTFTSFQRGEELNATVEIMLDELNGPITNFVRKVDGGFKTMFSMLEITPCGGSADNIMVLSRDTTSELQQDLASLKNSVMKLRTYLFHHDGDLLSEVNELYLTTHLFAENMTVCVDNLTSIIRELQHAKKETSVDENKDDMKSRLITNLHKQLCESLSLTARLLKTISRDYTLMSDDFFLLNQRVLMYGEIIRSMTHNAITEELLEHGGDATMPRVRQMIGDLCKERPVSSRASTYSKRSVSLRSSLEEIIETEDISPTPPPQCEIRGGTEPNTQVRQRHSSNALGAMYCTYRRDAQTMTSSDNVTRSVQTYHPIMFQGDKSRPSIFIMADEEEPDYHDALRESSFTFGHVNFNSTTTEEASVQSDMYRGSSLYNDLSFHEGHERNELHHDRVRDLYGHVNPTNLPLTLPNCTRESVEAVLVRLEKNLEEMTNRGVIYGGGGEIRELNLDLKSRLTALKDLFDNQVPDLPASRELNFISADKHRRSDLISIIARASFESP